jgi:DNA-binding winged helix-turn-helix (wHTH) protein
MYSDEIIEEVWHNRDKYAKSLNYDLNEIVKDLQKREKEHPQRIVTLKSNRDRFLAVSG